MENPQHQMGADKSAENTPNIFGPICLPKPKNCDFGKKNFFWVSVFRAHKHQ